MSEETPRAGPARDKAPSVYEHLALMLDQIAAVSWQKLGLQPDMVTGKLEPDIAEAKIAIDTAGFLVERLETQLDDDDRRRVQGLIRDLRINFVQKAKEADAHDG